MTRALSWIALLGVVWTVPARAQEPAARARAVQLFDEAQALMEQGKFSEACPKYAASMKLDPQLGALLHVADCYEKTGQLASAWGAFREAEEMARRRNDARVAIARESAARLEPRLSRLTLVVVEPSATPDLSVRLDGAPIASGAWGTAAPIDTGEHVVEARAPGFETWSAKITIADDGQRARLEVPRLRSLAAAPAFAPNVEQPLPSSDRSGFPLRTLGWVGVGVGAVGLGLGAYFFVQRQNRLDERAAVCPTLRECTTDQGARIHSLTSDARTADTAATLGFVAGGAVAAAGIVTLVVASRRHREEQAAWLAPAITRQGWMLAGGTKW